MRRTAKTAIPAHYYLLAALCFSFLAVIIAMPLAAGADLSTLPVSSFPKPNNEVDAMALGPDGTLYIGGAFTSIDGTARNHLAAISPNGTLSSWNPNVNGTVDVILVNGSTIYFGGEFTTVGGSTRNHIASADTAGTVSSWNPNANDTVSAFVLIGSTLYVGGDFTSIGGQARNFTAALDPTTGSAGTWNPNPNDSVFALATNGTTIYMGGYFTTVGGTARNRLAAVNATAGADQGWNPNANSFVASLAVANGIIYVGGDFTTIGTTTRHHVAAIDAQGVVSSWNPDANDLVAAIAPSGANVYLGGDFTSVAGQTRNHGAVVDTAGNLLPLNPNASSSIASIVATSSVLYAGGLFTTISGQAVPYLAAYTAISDSGNGTDTTAPQVYIASPITGGVITGPITVTVAASDSVGVAQVELYVNGVKLGTDTSSPYTFSWSPDTTVSATYTLIAKAYDAAGNVGTSTSVVVGTGNGQVQSGQVATPLITPNGGSFTQPISVSLTDTTPGATIRYTVDGSTPTAASPLYPSSLSLLLAADTTVKAIAIKDGMTPSPVATSTFSISFSEGGGTAAAADLPAGTSAGDVVKFTGNPAIYLVEDDGLHPFDTYSSYQGYVAAFHKSLKNIDDSADNYTLGQGLARDVVNIPATLSKYYPTGSLVSENGTIYLIIGTSAVPFTTMAAFTGLGYKTKYVVKGSLNGYTKATSYFITTPNMPHSWGAWLKVDAAHYYYMHESGMIRSPNAATFSTNGGQQKFILPANRYDLDILNQNPDLQPLVQHDSRIY